MKTSIRTFIMFQGNAEQAMTFYATLFPRCEITSILRYGPGEAGPEGTVKTASFTLGDQTVMCIDSPIKHDFTFTPAISFFATCESAEEIRGFAAALGENGTVFMPLDNYGFSREFTWLSDRFGISWQLNLE